jgi:hypothetical protein
MKADKQEKKKQLLMKDVLKNNAFGAVIKASADSVGLEINPQMTIQTFFWQLQKKRHEQIQEETKNWTNR